MFLPNGERIEIQPVHVGFGKVRLSIDAPGSVRILRREVTERLECEQVAQGAQGECEGEGEQAQESEGEHGERERD